MTKTVLLLVFIFFVHLRGYAVDKPDFAREVLPILSDKCYACHGPDAKKDEVRIDRYEDATVDLGGYKAINPQNLAESEIIFRIEDHDDPMPPEKDGKKLTNKEKQIIKNWILSGAEYAAHWSYVPPQKSKTKHKIDDFIEAKLKEENLQFAQVADKTTLARRTALILTGLPPNRKLLNDFLNSPKKNAYETFVNELLKTTSYGEHQARYWLDAIRYGDTHGLHLDNKRGIFPFRDWVVKAMNENLPLDKFIHWQLAGDLMPNPSLEQQIATGYVRMNPTTSEGGVIPAEFQAKNNFDRVENFGTVFLGMSMLCARCHTHKYDPITHDEYFQLMAFFNSTAENPLDGNAYIYRPVLNVPVEPSLWSSWEGLEKKHKTFLNKTQAKDKNFKLNNSLSIKDQLLSLVNHTKNWKGLKIKSQQDDVKVESNLHGLVEKKALSNKSIKVSAHLTPQTIQSIRLDIMKDKRIRKNGPGYGPGGVFNLNQILVEVRRSTGELEKVELSKVVSNDGKQGREVKHLLNVDPEKGWTGADKQGLPHYAVLQLKSPLKVMKGDTINFELINHDPKKWFGMFKFSVSESGMDHDQQKALAYIADYEKFELTTTLVAKELDRPRETFRLNRGEYNQPVGKALQPDVMELLGKMPDNLPKNRLGLAKWLTSKDHPLTARVLVNRLWQQVFGHALVRTPEEFGLQGEQPTHPELLDYLAISLQEKGWDLKALLKEMVMSRTFQQSSSFRDDVSDPENKLWARGPSFRLDAEVIRDTGLLASGLLFNKLGGEGVKPYQPANMWSELMHPASNTKKYIKDEGDKNYKKSLYVYWKRTSPHPMMTLFDAPSREVSCVKRSRSNTPLQSLGMLNEFQRVEAARVLAEGILQYSKDDRERLNELYLRVLSRTPTDREASIQFQLLSNVKKEFSANHQHANDFVKIGDSGVANNIDVIELAAWSQLSTILLASDAAILLY